MKFKPIQNRVVLDITKEKEVKQVNGLYLPPDKNSDDIGIVYAISDKEDEYTIGESVIYNKHAGNSVNMNIDGEDKNFLFIEKSYILSKIDNTNK